MQFDSFSAFLDMGGYGFYVWLSYGVSAALLTLLFISSRSKDSNIRKQIIARQKREDKLRQAADQQKQAAEQAKEPITENDSNEVLS